jgi:hypothetical protein
MARARKVVLSPTSLERLFALPKQRKRRSNAGKKRGPRPGVKAGMLPALFASPKRGARLVSPGSLMGLAGMKIIKKRGRPAKSKPMRLVSPGSLMGLAGMKIVPARKTRKNKGVKRGPRWLAALPKL